MTDKRPHPQSSAAQRAIIESAMSKMTSATPPIYDVTIVCTTDDFQVGALRSALCWCLCRYIFAREEL